MATTNNSAKSHRPSSRRRALVGGALIGQPELSFMVSGRPESCGVCGPFLEVLHHQKVDALMTAVPTASADRISLGRSLAPEVTAIRVRHYSPAERRRLPYKGLAADVTALGVRTEPPCHNSWIAGNSETNHYSLIWLVIGPIASQGGVQAQGSTKV